MVLFCYNAGIAYIPSVYIEKIHPQVVDGGFLKEDYAQREKTIYVLY